MSYAVKSAECNWRGKVQRRACAETLLGKLSCCKPNELDTVPDTLLRLMLNILLAGTDYVVHEILKNLLLLTVQCSLPAFK